MVNLAWVVNAYLIAFGGLLLLAGRLGDLVGRKRLFMAGLAVFTTASAVCGLADSQTQLIVARFAQGLGGAMTSAVVLGMIVTMFPEPGEQARAIGIYGFVASAGGAVGLLAGGVLTQAINWHWIFFVNVPLGLATAVLATRLLGRDEGRGFRAGADVPGALLITCSLMLGVYTIVKPTADDGWSSGHTLLLGTASLVLLGVFVAREATARNPLVPLRVFRSRAVAGANLVQVLTVAGMFGMFFLGSLYLERVLGYDALQIGLAFLPFTIVMGLLSLRYSGRLITRFGAAKLLVPGLAMIGAGLLVFTQAPATGDYVRHVLPVMILIAVGVGVAFPAIMTMAMSGSTEQDAGLASGLVNTSVQVGGALGLAVLATVSTTRSHALLHRGNTTASALTSGYHLAFLIAAVLVAAAIGVALLMLKPETTTTSQRDMHTDRLLGHAEPCRAPGSWHHAPERRRRESCNDEARRPGLAVLAEHRVGAAAGDAAAPVPAHRDRQRGGAARCDDRGAGLGEHRPVRVRGRVGH